MDLALVQFNSVVGDASANASRMIDLLNSGDLRGADLVVFPELCISGYPPKDLVLYDAFIDLCAREAARVGQSAPRDMTVVFGVPLAVDLLDPLTGGPAQRAVANSLLAWRGGHIIARYDKRLLPTYDVFDEDRYFVASEKSVVIDVPTRSGMTWRVGLSICEDLWRGEDAGFSHRYLHKPDPVAELISEQADGSPGAELIINPSASPFVLGKAKRHRAILSGHAKRHNVFVAAVNCVGGNDELVFDGFACLHAPGGGLIAAAPGFIEHVLRIPISRTPTTHHAPAADPAIDTCDDELLFRALVLGTQDYLRKTGFSTCVLGLSGGIDSAVTAVIACGALGTQNVLGVRMPSQFSSEGSLADAAALANNLGIKVITIPIENAFESLEAALAPTFERATPDVTEENMQSRVRGAILMAISNKFRCLLLTTGNKSELGVGYCTLYGDMNGGLGVLSDVSKHWVYRLARWMNAHPDRLGIPGVAPSGPIPEATILKPPSAELRPNQKDQDSLPEYDELDDILDRYVVKRQSVHDIIRIGGHDPVTVARVIRLIDTSEFKRKQAAIGIKVTGVAFGSGRRMPIAQNYRPDKDAAN